MFGVSSSRRFTGETGTPKWRGFEKKDWEVSERYRLGCRAKNDILTPKTNLRMAADTLLLAPQYLDHQHTIRMTFIPGNQLLMLRNIILKDEFYSCLIFLSQGLISVKRILPSSKKGITGRLLDRHGTDQDTSSEEGRKLKHRLKEGKSLRSVEDQDLKTNCKSKPFHFAERMKETSERENTATQRSGKDWKIAQETDRRTKKRWQISIGQCRRKTEQVRCHDQSWAINYIHIKGRDLCPNKFSRSRQTGVYYVAHF